MGFFDWLSSQTISDDFDWSDYVDDEDCFHDTSLHDD